MAGKEVQFAATPSMASYLNVLCVGELDAIEKKSGGVLHRVVATRGKAEMGRYALDSSAQVTEYFDEYFGTPYPLPKLDEIAVPGGFGGAMENWGGITYFESRLLYDPRGHPPPKPSKPSTPSSRTRSRINGSAISSRWRGGITFG